jgi:hypothetical protein
MTSPRDPMLRMPRSPSAQLRRDMRIIGVRRAARRWGISGVDALRICAGLAVRASSIETVLRLAWASARGRRG